MKIEKAGKRDRKINRRRNGHRTDGRSVFVIEEVIQKKAEKSKAERRKKQREDAES